jgi:endothelin-converting enzyme
VSHPSLFLLHLTSSVSLVADSVDTTLKHVLEQSKANIVKDDSKIFKMASDSYIACMDEDTLKEVGLDTLKEVVSDVKSQLSTTNSRSPNHGYNLQQPSKHAEERGDFLTDLLASTIKLGAPAFLSFQPMVCRHVLHLRLPANRVQADDQDPSKQTLFAAPVHAVGLPSPEMYSPPSSPVSTTSDLLADYTAACNQSLTAVMNPPLNATIWNRGFTSSSGSKTLAERIVGFEAQIAGIVPSMADEEDVSKSHNKLDSSSFDKLLPQVRLSDLFKKVSSSTSAPSNIIVTSTKYLEDLSIILQKTDKQTLQAFFVWKVVQAWADRVEHSSLAKLKALNAELTGAQSAEAPERWRKCVRDVNEDLGWITSYFYVSSLSLKTAKKTARIIIDEVKAAFTKVLIDATWMSQDDRQTAATKARNIDSSLSHPSSKPDLESPSTIEDFYSLTDLKLAKDEYLQNGIAVMAQQVQRRWSKAAGQPTNKDEWDLYSTAVNAYYNPALNKMFVPAAMLQNPDLYDDGIPDYVAFGSFGSVAGHEMSHAFDPVGAHYDKDGKYDDWWSDESAKLYNDKAQCFADQYSSYKVEGPDGDLTIDGNLTLAEAIADAGGAHAAFKAYKEREQKIKSQVLPGLEKFSKDQTFWLAYGSFWCSETQPEQLEQIVLSDPHGPKSVRILGTVANNRGFREAWQCPEKEPTCDLW